MKKLQEPPAKLTKQEVEKLRENVHMHDWHFETLMVEKCTLIGSNLIGWTEDNKPIYVATYGLRAVKTDTKKPCIANFFIRHGYRVYQTYDINDVADLIGIIKKEFKLEEYEEKLWEEKAKQRQLARETKQKEAKSGKLKVV